VQFANLQDSANLRGRSATWTSAVQASPMPRIASLHPG
jgi:hypothetical protein